MQDHITKDNCAFRHGADLHVHDRWQALSSPELLKQGQVGLAPLLVLHEQLSLDVALLLYLDAAFLKVEHVLAALKVYIGQSASNP